MLDQMEKELGKELSLPPPPPREYKPAKRSRVQDQAILALKAAGKKGLTSRELAEVAQIPFGSASSRLTLMLREGLVNRDRSKYFVVHSTQEDNNADA
jgi:hypothetical protein